MAWEKQDLTLRCYETKYLYSDEAISYAGKLISEDKGLAGKVDEIMKKFRDIEFGKKPLEAHMEEISKFYSISQYRKYDLSVLVIYSASIKDKDSPDHAELIFPVHPIMVADHIYKKQSKRNKYFGPIGSQMNKWMYNRDRRVADEKMTSNLAHHVFGFKEIIRDLEDFQNKFHLSINRKELERLKKEKPEGFKEQQNNQ